MAYPDQDCYQVNQVAKYGPVFGDYALDRKQISITDPELIKDIFIKDFHVFADHRRWHTGSSTVNMILFFMPGNDDWKRVRSAISPVFTASKLRSMMASTTDISDRLVECLAQFEQKGEIIDIYKYVGGFAMDVLSASAFGINAESISNPDNPIITNAKKAFAFNYGFGIIMSILWPRMARLLRCEPFDIQAIQYFETLAKRLIDDRKARINTDRTKFYKDFLQIMLDSEISVDQTNTNYDLVDKDSDETFGNPMANNNTLIKGTLTTDELSAQALQFLIAGYDTTSAAITHALYYLSQHKDCQQILYEELQSCDEFTYEKLSQLKYLNAVINETLRLAPSLTRIQRECVQDYKLGNTGITILKGTSVEILSYALHRQPDLWPNPNDFIPDRFINPTHHPYAYIPFGGGPRVCIGQRFAMQEMRMCLAKLVNKFELNLTQSTKKHVITAYREQSHLFLMPFILGLLPDGDMSTTPSGSEPPMATSSTTTTTHANHADAQQFLPDLAINAIADKVEALLTSPGTLKKAIKVGVMAEMSALREIAADIRSKMASFSGSLNVDVDVQSNTAFSVPSNVESLLKSLIAGQESIRKDVDSLKKKTFAGVVANNLSSTSDKHNVSPNKSTPTFISTPIPLRPTFSLEFETERERDIIIKEINEKSDVLTSEPSKKKRPLIELKGVLKDVTEEELIKSIIDQNSNVELAIGNDFREEHLKVRFRRKNRNDRLINYVIEVSPKTSNVKYGKQEQTSHAATSKYCPHVQKMQMRATEMTDYVYGFELINCGNTPTFDTIRGHQRLMSVVDLTLASNAALPNVRNWRVEQEIIVNSDHNPILFDINLGEELMTTDTLSTFKYRSEKADWDTFTEVCNKGLLDGDVNILSVESITDVGTLDVLVGRLTDAINAACAASMPLRKRGKKICPWWTLELEDKKREVQRLRRRLRNAINTPPTEAINEYKKCKEEYAQLISDESIKSWKEYVGRQGKDNVWSNVYRILKDSPTPRPPTTLLINGNYTTDAKTTATALLNHFYPDDTLSNETQQQTEVRRSSSILNADATDDVMFTYDEILEVFDLRIRELSMIDDVKTTGISQHIPSDSEYQGRVDFRTLEHPANRITVSHNDVQTSDAANDLERDVDISIYTDGSKLNGKVGSAFVVYENSNKTSHHTQKLGNDCSVFQAELIAINAALQYTLKRQTSSIRIFSDSKSALQAL
ncbi:unnamed protein product, partial [Medioppia subpectinata]